MIVVKIRENSLIIDGHSGYRKRKRYLYAGVTLYTNRVKSIEDLTEDKSNLISRPEGLI